MPIAALAIVLGLIGYFFLVPYGEIPTGHRIMVATGEPDGVYDRYSRALDARSDLNIASRNTVGSVENLRLLRSREADFAIVQSDVAQHSFLGERGQQRFRDLSIVLPLFPERVQIILRRDSEVNVLGDLRGRRICTGPEGSGTHFNSLDILAEAQLRESIDFVPLNSSRAECLASLASGQNVDAVFVTSNLDYAARNPRLRQLYLSESALSSLVARRPYLRILRSGAGDAAGGAQLAVDAVLVTHASQSSASVYALVRSLIEHWEDPRLGVANPIRPGRSGGRMRGIAQHPAARSALISSGMQQEDYYFYLFMALWSGMLILCLLSERAKNSYNRLGESTISDWSHRLLVKHVGRISHLFLALTFLLLFFAGAVYLLLQLEDVYSQRAGVVSPFTTMSFVDSVLWLFTYIASGFNADGIYPVSLPGKAIVALLAVVGLVAPITVVLLAVNAMSQKAKRRLEGFGSTGFKRHVLVCGWNEKALGLIYTLTGSDVDRRMKVVLVADMDERYPLERYQFNAKYVVYCRGDSADASVLARARIEDASVVIVLADFKASVTHNRKSILTAMSARRMNQDAYICAELEYDDNIDFFQAGGCNSLVCPGLIVSRLAAITILDPYLLDYVLDVVTYHDYDELRSASVATLDPSLRAVGRPICEMELDLLPLGVHVVGVLHSAPGGNLRKLLYSEDNRSELLLDGKHRSQPLDPSDILVYSAQKAGITPSREIAGQGFSPLLGRRFEIAYPRGLRVLVCADSATIELLCTELSCIVDDLQFTGIDVEDEPLRYIEQFNRAAPHEYDSVVILAPRARRSELTGFDDLNDLDADLMMLTKLVREALRARGSEPTVICELGSIKNRELLLDSGADIILPALTAVERFLAKEAYDRNHVGDFLMTAMRLDDGVHLHSHVVRAGDGFCGERYSDILATPIEGLKVLGWLPAAERELLSNRLGDFRFHFRTVVDRRLRTLTSAEGDVIIMMIERQDEYRSASRIELAPPADERPIAAAPEDPTVALASAEAPH